MSESPVPTYKLEDEDEELDSLINTPSEQNAEPVSRFFGYTCDDSVDTPSPINSEAKFDCSLLDAQNDSTAPMDVQDAIPPVAPSVMTPTSSNQLKDSFQVHLTKLLPKEIAKCTLQSTDDLMKMLQKTVERKVEMYIQYGKNGKLKVQQMDLSFPESYASKLKNDKSLVEAIISPICQMVEKIDDLILPELGIDTIHYLIAEKSLLAKVQSCSFVRIPFSCKSADELDSNLPDVIKATMDLKPGFIELLPDQPSTNVTDMKKSSTLKKKLKEMVGSLTTLKYGSTTIAKGASGIKPSKKRPYPLGGDTCTPGPENKKSKASNNDKAKPKKMKLIPIPQKGNTTKFTFDSFQSQLEITDPPFTAYTYWQLEKVHRHTMGKGTTIAIVDGGIDPSHPAFSNAQMDPEHFRDFCLSGINPTDSHGTLCAGIACGNEFRYPLNPYEENLKENLFPNGVAPEAKFIICKVLLHGEEKAAWKTVLEALNWLIDMVTNSSTLIDVVSLSLGSLKFVPEIAQAIAKLVDRNVIVVCAASNLGYKFSQPICFPARLGNVLCIGSHGQHGKPSPFSPVGQQIDFLAPGEQITGPSSEIMNHYLMTESGTSFAAPAVAGLICLILSYIKDNSPEYLKFFKNQYVMKEILREISTSPGRHSDDQGFGALNPMQFFQQPARVLDAVLQSVVFRPDDD